MANWRKQQGESQHQMGHRRPSSYHRKPPLNKCRSSVCQWERKFIESISSIPWETLQENKKYVYLFEKVCKWDDSAGKEAFDNAKMRYWAEINGISCNISLPDPNIFIDEIDWNATVDPNLVLEAENKLARVYYEECREDKVEIVEGSLYLNGKKLPCTGWEDDEAPVLKHFDPNSACQGEGSNLQENNVVENGLKDFDPVEHAKKYEQKNWRNDAWHSNHKEHYGGSGDWQHKMGRGRNDGGYGNWETWDGYHRRREHISWSKTPPAYNGNDEYHKNRGRRNNRGGGRGNFEYVPKDVRPTPTPVPAPAAW